MTNNEIIFETVRSSFSADQLAELVNATHRRENQRPPRVKITVARGQRRDSDGLLRHAPLPHLRRVEAHEVQREEGPARRWSAISGSTPTSPARPPARPQQQQGREAPEVDPHFYMAKAHLFHALQVEKSKR